MNSISWLVGSGHRSSVISSLSSRTSCRSSPLFAWPQSPSPRGVGRGANLKAIPPGLRHTPSPHSPADTSSGLRRPSPHRMQRRESRRRGSDTVDSRATGRDVFCPAECPPGRERVSLTPTNPVLHWFMGVLWRAGKTALDLVFAGFRAILAVCPLVH